MAQELLKGLKHIQSCKLDLFVTIPKDVYAHELEKSIVSLFPDAKIITLENRGYDVYPFCHVLNMVDLSQYEHIVKIHTKRNMDAIFITRFFLFGSRWRKKLLSFLASEQSFQNCLNAFRLNPRLGMIAEQQLIKKLWLDNKEGVQAVSEMAREMHIPFSDKWAFVAGTMFVARAQLFVPLQKLQLKGDQFPCGRSKVNMSLAHILERIFGVLVYSQGFVLDDCLSPLWKKNLIICYNQAVDNFVAILRRF
jgi:lipopolysaccharide biosynthesis protein